MPVQFNEIDLHIELQGEPCEMTEESMVEWFKNHIESLADNYDGSISVDIISHSRRTRNFGSNEM